MMYDVVEHVDDLTSVLDEVNRVTSYNGMMASSTANQFSLGAEPDVGV